MIERWSPAAFAAWAVLLNGGLLAGVLLHSPLWALGWIPVAPFTLVGVFDTFQRQHTIQRNFPVLGRLRYLLESLRPEIRQYFIESDQEETPISREKRAIVYQRAKGQLDTLPFGTKRDVDQVGYEWINHSLMAVAPAPDADERRIRIGGPRCEQPYASSLLNISAMSYGSLSAKAILALGRGAALGGFSHNTGEGGLSPYHLEHGADLVWQVGTGYFGCRTLEGEFDPERFQEKARHDAVKMIELKLSQGAKPGHGGILPAAKVTDEIAEIRHVPKGRDVISPPSHAAFRTPIELLEFLDELRRLSGGKPVGFKLCVGSRREFFCIVKAMLETGLAPDFITVDGGEGGTGAAPLEFSNSVGAPANEGLSFIHNALLGAGLRDQVRIIAAGKITTGFHVVKKLALGADLTNSARAMMLAVGCIQAVKCNSNDCPVGVASHKPKYTRGLDVLSKSQRVLGFHRRTVEAVYELIAAAGLEDPDDLRPHHIYRRTDIGVIRTYSEIFAQLEPRVLVDGTPPAPFDRLWDAARADSFARA
ncbi:MAG: FMN-binding glutamate synthase family protein [Sandaracinus sp.]|nr:FMN-binding glutamate synthase family protein [Myxococcales bacterium]MAT28746.1 FMN-binding glutamate synthase family protein [Sandaracinus sp.]MBJ74712.1 FMN-binding glutamate synthase family protein [Sandaracinus sp.]